MNNIYTCKYSDDGFLSLERLHNGAYHMSALVNNSYVHEQYHGYSMKRALQLFREKVQYVKKGVHCLNW